MARRLLSRPFLAVTRARPFACDMASWCHTSCSCSTSVWPLCSSSSSQVQTTNQVYLGYYCLLQKQPFCSLTSWPPTQEHCEQNTSVATRATTTLKQPRVLTTETEIHRALGQIWNHTSSSPKKFHKKNPFKALNLLHDLLWTEHVTDKKEIVQAGIAYNVFKACQKSTKHNHENCRDLVNRFKHILDLLQENERLWTTATTTNRDFDSNAAVVMWPSLVLGILSRCAVNHKNGMEFITAAQELLQGMHQEFVKASCRNDVTHLVKPNLQDYGDVLRAYAQLGMAQEAETLLETMEQRHCDGYLLDKPNTISYTVVVDALAKSLKYMKRQGGYYNRRQAQEQGLVVQRAEELVKRMEQDAFTKQPNEITYGALLKCYANLGMGNQAVELLTKMHRLHESQILKHGPNIVSYTIVMEALARSDVVQYPQAPYHCRELLDSIHEMHCNGHGDMKPKNFTHGLALKCFCRFGWGQESIQLLMDIHDLYNARLVDEPPNTYMYNYAMDAIVTSDTDNAPQQAEALLNLMQEMSTTAATNHVAPNVVTFATIQKCFIKRGMTLEAERLLLQMQDRHDIGLLKEPPTTKMYMELLECHVQQSNTGKAQVLLQDMMDLYKRGKLSDPPPLAETRRLGLTAAKETKPPQE